MDEAARSQSIMPAALPLHYGNTIHIHSPAAIYHLNFHMENVCEKLLFVVLLFPLTNVKVTGTETSAFYSLLFFRGRYLGSLIPIYILESIMLLSRV